MSFDKKRLPRANALSAVVMLVSLLVLGSSIFKDANAARMTQQLGSLDTAVLWFVRQHIPSELTGFFTWVTATDDANFLVPATVVMTAIFLIFKRRRDALRVAISMACAGIFTFAIKALVNRSRPDLWGAAWYSSSSFPSGHTLSTTAFATALVLCAARVWPRSRYTAMELAALGVALMGLSRLVLGAHWPSDVLAATMLGFLIPLAVSAYLERYAPGWTDTTCTRARPRLP